MAVQVGDILEFTYQSTLYSQRVLTILHYVVTVAPTVDTSPLASQDAFLQRVKSGGAQNKVTKYLDCLSDNLTLNYIVAQYVYPPRYRASRLAQAIAGSRGGVAGAPNISAVIEKLSDRAGKSNRGNLHLPGIVNADYASGIITNTLNNLMVILASELTQLVTEAGGGAGVWTPVIFHRRTPATTPTPFNAYAIMQTLRTMRRRTVGVGK